MAEVAPTIAGPIAETKRPGFAVPEGACDCHAHVFGPQSRYAYDPKRRYTPPDALPSDYVRLLTTLGFTRGVLVQPSVYMTDNTALCDALAETDFAFRGIAVVGETVSDAELARMHELGVRGLRLNMRVENGVSPDIAPALARRIAPMGWHLNFRAMPDDFANLQRLLDQLEVDITIDHIGALSVEEGVTGQHFQTLLEILATGRAMLKLSAPMRISATGLPYADVTPLVRALVDAAPTRMLFATDWPHTGVHGTMPNDGDLVDLLQDWVPDAATRRLVLVDNPAFRYGF